MGHHPILRFPARPLLRDALAGRPWPLTAIFTLVLFTTSLNLLAPWMQREFVNRLKQGTEALPWALAAFCASVAAQLVSYLFRTLATREGLGLQRALSDLLYRKALRLAPEGRSGKTVGEIVTYYVQDVATAASIVEDFLPTVLSALLPILLAPLALGALLQVPLHTILLVLVVTLSFTFWLGTRQAYFFALNKRNAAHRLSLVNEWLQNIRVLRALGWVKSFEDEMKARREQESRDRLRMVTNGSTMNSLTQTLPFLLNLATVWTFVSARGHTLAPGDIFAILWIFGVFMARPLRNLPFLLVTWNDITTSSRRIAHFLNLPEEPESASPNSTSSRVNPISLSVRGLSVNLESRKILSDISFSFEPGEFIAIVGEVGAGKSVLLQALLRAIPAEFQEYTLGGRDATRMDLGELRAHFALAPQEPFVMSSSLRDNIALNYETDPGQDETLTSLLSLAEFSASSEHLPAGIATPIGERGVNLSGGQRQRVNLARCAYFQRPILLLDDTLSAVDVDTEHKLEERLLSGAWKNHTRLLVTHRFSILPKTDRILILEGGRLVEQGPSSILLAHSPSLARLAARGAK